MTAHANGHVGAKANNNNGRQVAVAVAPPVDLAGLHDRGTSPKTQNDDRAFAAAILLHLQSLVGTLTMERPLVGNDIRTVADGLEHLANIVRVRASEWPAP